MVFNSYLLPFCYGFATVVIPFFRPVSRFELIKGTFSFCCCCCFFFKVTADQLLVFASNISSG